MVVVELQLLLKILAVYFFAYGVVWLIGIAISKSFPKDYIKLGQWILMWLKIRIVLIISVICWWNDILQLIELFVAFVYNVIV